MAATHYHALCFGEKSGNFKAPSFRTQSQAIAFMALQVAWSARREGTILSITDQTAQGLGHTLTIEDPNVPPYRQRAHWMVTGACTAPTDQALGTCPVERWAQERWRKHERDYRRENNILETQHG